jgi:hypothetical protein
MDYDEGYKKKSGITNDDVAIWFEHISKAGGTSFCGLAPTLYNCDSRLSIYERKTSFCLRAFFDLVFASQLCDANGSTNLHPSWL